VTATVTASAAPATIADEWRRSLAQLVCFWSAAVFMNAFGTGLFAMAHLLPPLAPSLSGEDLATIFHAKSAGIRWGMILLVLFFGAGSLFAGLVVSQMKRMEGVSPALAYGYLVALASSAVPSGLLFVPLFVAGALRGYSPPIMVMMDDLGYFSFIGVLGCFFVQYAVLALAVFLDRSRLYPKWFGYVCIWSSLTEVMAIPLWIFRTGPFTWAGLLVFWIGLPIFMAWQICLMVCMWKAMPRLARGASVA
jgi:hypothetical protein